MKENLFLLVHFDRARILFLSLLTSFSLFLCFGAGYFLGKGSALQAQTKTPTQTLTETKPQEILPKQESVAEQVHKAREAHFLETSTALDEAEDKKPNPPSYQLYIAGYRTKELAKKILQTQSLQKLSTNLGTPMVRKQAGSYGVLFPSQEDYKALQATARELSREGGFGNRVRILARN